MLMLARLTLAAALMALPAAAQSNIPLNDLGSALYLGQFQGGLYENGSNSMPFDHLSRGLAQAALVRPLDRNGDASPAGSIVMISLGMSNPSQVFCATANPAPCESWSFVGQATADPEVDHSKLAFVNGARSGQNAATWLTADVPNFDYLRRFDLAPAGFTEAQVQVAWVKLANSNPTVSLPAANAEAYRLLVQLGSTLRAMKTRFPNLRMVYLSSRSYAGYAEVPLNPEPYAYEYGFTVKWLVQAQINQLRTGGIDARAGNLGLDVAPWIAWGPYVWADGMNPRSDGLTWSRSDFESDGTHPSQAGEQKEAALILAFFKQEITAKSWFLENFAGRRRSIRH